jgi:hypothetical protein
MKKVDNSALGATVAGAMLLGLAAVEFFAASAPAGANLLTAAMGGAMLIAGLAGLGLD